MSAEESESLLRFLLVILAITAIFFAGVVIGAKAQYTLYLPLVLWTPPSSLWDLNHDCIVDYADTLLIIWHYKCIRGQACYAKAWDFDGDGENCIHDVSRVFKHENSTSWPCPAGEYNAR